MIKSRHKRLYIWITEKFQLQCSHTCGTKGRKTRRLYCMTVGGKKVNRFYCSKKFKPPRREKCNERKCYAMSCYEAKTYFNATKDGEYTLVMAGRNMSIYCHGMSTSQPKEYLTLPAGPEENYAEINDQRFARKKIRITILTMPCDLEIIYTYSC